MSYICIHGVPINCSFLELIDPEGLIFLVDKFKNVNLFDLNYNINNSYSDCEGDYEDLHFVFGAIDKKSAMRVFIQEYFSDIFNKIRNYMDGVENVSLSKAFSVLYNFGEVLIADVEKFGQISKEAITFNHIKSYLAQNANKLISDMRKEYLLEAEEEEDSARVVIAYFKKNYPREYNKLYGAKYGKLSIGLSIENTNKFKPLGIYFKKTKDTDIQ
jgi:hypothetical protein